MKTRIHKNGTNKNFSLVTTENVFYLNLDVNYVFEDRSLLVRDELAQVFDRISTNEEIKVLVIINNANNREFSKYLDIASQAIDSNYHHKMIHKACNVFDQLILDIVGLNKFVIHADGRKRIPLFFNLGFACDYRIIASHSIYQKSYLKINSLPKGGCIYFLGNMLGSSKAKKLLLSNRDISAQMAVELGIADQAVPVKDVINASQKIAKDISQLPERTILGIKNLANFSVNELGNYLRMENRELLKGCGVYDYF